MIDRDNIHNDPVDNIMTLKKNDNDDNHRWSSSGQDGACGPAALSPVTRCKSDHQENHDDNDDRDNQDDHDDEIMKIMTTMTTTTMMAVMT